MPCSGLFHGVLIFVIFVVDSLKINYDVHGYSTTAHKAWLTITKLNSHSIEVRTKAKEMAHYKLMASSCRGLSGSERSRSLVSTATKFIKP